MENYNGVKIVKVEPQTKNGISGYCVKHLDGYVSYCKDFINSEE